MLSRVADNLYWFGRYLQRAENTARLINVNDSVRMDLPKHLRLGWDSLVDIVGAQAAFDKLYTEPSEANVLQFLVLDERNPGSVLSSLRQAREILRASRDTLPGETWEKINDLHRQVQAGGEKSLQRRHRQGVLSTVTDGCITIFGLLIANMSRDLGFQFLGIGTHLEQADMTTRIIDARSTPVLRVRQAGEVTPFETVQWMSVLRSLTGTQMYRRHVRHRVSGPQVLRFLLQNREFPRSVMFCLTSIERTLPALPQSRPMQRALERAKSLVRDADLDALLDDGLKKFLDEVQVGLAAFHEALTVSCFRG